MFLQESSKSHACVVKVVLTFSHSLSFSITDLPVNIDQYIYLNTIVAEKQAGISCSGHLQAGNPTPHGRLPYKESEGAALTALVTLTEHI